MPSLQEIAPRDLVRSFTVRIDAGDGKPKVEVPVRYYPNRITLNPIEVQLDEDEAAELSQAEIDALSSASVLCTYLEWWDMQGPVLHTQTGEVLLPAGQDIPLEPQLVQHISSPIIGEFMRQLTEHVFPNAKPSRNARRRLR